MTVYKILGKKNNMEMLLEMKLPPKLVLVLLY